MSDYNSSLPVRTENPGDVSIKIVDSTITSQQLKVEADGSINVNAALTVSSVEISNDVGNPIPVSASSLPLPTGASTLAEQQVQSSSLSSIDSKLTGPLTVQATNLDIRDLAFATDKIDVSGSSVSVSNFPAVQAVSATDFDIRDLSHVGDSVKIGDGTDVMSVNSDGSINTKEVNVVGISDYNSAAAIAAAATSTHTYTSTGNFYLTGVESSGSGKCKILVSVNSVDKATLFNSTSSPNMSIEFKKPLLVTSGQTVVVSRTNRDNQSQDLYSTIMGFLS